MAGARLTGRAGSVYIEGLDSLLKDLSKAPRELNNEIRKEARGIAKTLATDIKDAAKEVTPGSAAQASLAAVSVQGRSDRVVYVKGGGSRVLRTTKKVPKPGGKGTRTVRRSKPLLASQIFFGSEFGSKLPQFPPHAGKQGYYFWPTIRKKNDWVVSQYLDALEKVLRSFGATP